VTWTPIFDRLSASRAGPFLGATPSQRYTRGVTSQPQMPIIIRPATPADAPAAGQICFDAFTAINRAHNYPPDFPHVEHAIGLLTTLFGLPGWHCLVAEEDGRILGSNCLDERSIINGIGPITVDPTAQNRGVGRILMQAALNRAASTRVAGVRLVQAAFHLRSLSLYTTLGFDVREPLACMQGRTSTRSIPGCTVRAATPADLAACNELSVTVHGYNRSADLAQSIERGTAVLTERDNRITAYASLLGFFGHATAETTPDLCALIASADTFAGSGILVPTRNAALFRWCLANGLRVVQPLTLMSTGLYNTPAGAFLPSILF
jgi:GNAT superfamily N-acetyltransferase